MLQNGQKRMDCLICIALEIASLSLLYSVSAANRCTVQNAPSLTRWLCSAKLSPHFLQCVAFTFFEPLGLLSTNLISILFLA